MNKLFAILFVTVLSAASASEYGYFLDPNASSVATVLPVQTPAPAQIAPFNAIPRALPGTIQTVMRMRHEWPKVAGVTRIDHGTGTLVDGLVLTARHVIEGTGVNLCEINGAWVPLRLIAEDADIDIAFLEPTIPIAPQPYNVVDGCHSSVKGTPIAVLPMRRLSTLWMNIPGFHHGASGSPIIENGHVIAVAVAIRSETESDFVQIVPFGTWSQLWEKVRTHSTVASK